MLFALVSPIVFIFFSACLLLMWQCCFIVVFVVVDVTLFVFVVVVVGCVPTLLVQRFSRHASPECRYPGKPRSVKGHL